MTERISEKKKALLALKEEILRDIKHCEKCIEMERSYKKDSSYFDADDSDSDAELTLELDTYPSTQELQSERDMLQTCLHATQELTSLCVLQSQVVVLVDDPVFERGPPVTEQGTWREVTAECRVDLVPFTITFYAHQPDRPFGPISYRSLRVQPVKTVHETELNKSVLSQVTTPSEAIEVLRNYASAHRERRTILARLAAKHNTSLFMEPLADGGYLLKCADLLKVSWSLDNKWSPLAAFYHKMKFDLEYMDEAYVRIISQAYKKLSDPAIEMDERLQLLNRIIETCLEAQGPTQELYESMESDIESENLRKRRTTLDQEIEEPVHKRQRDSDVMAPPKALPKKIKPKGKDNKADNDNQGKAAKRSVGDNKLEGAKKAKLSDEGMKNNNGVSKSKKNTKESGVAANSLDTKASGRKNVAGSKNTNSNNGKNNVVTTENVAEVASSKKSVANSKNIAKEVVKSKGSTDDNIRNKNKADNVNKHSEQIYEGKQSKNNVSEKIVKDKNAGVTNKPKQSKGKDIVDNLVTNAQNNKNKGTKQNTVDNVAISNNKIVNKNTLKAKSTSNINENARIESVDNVANIKNKAKSMDRPKSASHKKEIDVNTNSKNNVNLQSNSVKGDNIVEKGNEKPDKIVKKIPKDGSNNKNGDKKHEKLNKVTKNSENNVNTKVNNEKVTKVTQNKDEKFIDNNAGAATEDLNEIAKKQEKSKKEINNSEHIAKVNTENATKINKNSVPNKAIKVNKNLKSNNNIEKPTKEPNLVKAMTSSKQHDTLQKVIVKSSAQSKNSDKLSEKHNENATKNVDVLRNVENITTTTTSKSTTTNKTNKTKDVINKNNENIPKVGKSTKRKPELNSVNDKNAKIDSETSNKTKNIPKNPRTVETKSPRLMKKLVLHNVRDKKSMDNLKMNNKFKQNDLKKLKGEEIKTTKIPQRLNLKNIRGDFNENPLRVIPKKMLSNFKMDSQNISKSSQSSLQKVTTAIPRLMKKLVLKSK